MKNDALIFLVLYKSQMNIKEKTLIGYLNLNSIIYGKSLIENDESRVQTSFSSNWWLIEKRFYKRETIRSKKIFYNRETLRGKKRFYNEETIRVIKIS